MSDSTFRERFQESNDRFQNAMVAAIREHQLGVAIFLEADTQLHESVDELQRLILAQGVELRAQGVEIRALRAELEGRS